jgi:hypothetical protein
MGYCWVLHHHPDWLLKSAATGRPFQFTGYPGIWEADYGNRAYQRQWIANVLADVRSHGWDGVDIDDALTTSDYGRAAKYPTSSSIQAATYSALQQVGPALHQAGVASVVNVGYAPRFPGLWQQWLGPVGGLEQQFYLYGAPSTGATGAQWQVYQDEVSACAAQHKSCWFSSGDFSASVIRRERDYVLASFLLATDGRQYLSYGNAVSRPALLCPALGPAVAGSVRLTGSVWRRSFAHGTALVNPSSSAQDILSGKSGVRVGAASGTVLSSPGHSCL